MPTEDAIRWNSRYQEDPHNSFELPRSLLQDHADIIPTRGLALDVAMGLGGNANYLIQLGLQVIGVDISFIAMSKAKNRFPTLMAVVADLANFYIPQNTFNVVINFLYLQRGLWLPMTRALKNGGVLFIECLTDDMLAVHPDINPVYLLKPGELMHAFSHDEIGTSMEILFYSEGWQLTTTSHPRAVANIIARRST